MSQDVASKKRSCPKALEELQVFAASCARVAEKVWPANTKLKARTLTNSISHLDGKIELPAWQFVGACPTVTKFLSICGFAVDYFSAETDSGIGLP